ncbi:hypothetical protein BLAT2472_10481 [Burkholderia latens]
MRYQAALRSDEPEILSPNRDAGQSRYSSCIGHHELLAIGDNSEDDVRHAVCATGRSAPTHGETS